jgi:hypothetical protein
VVLGEWREPAEETPSRRIWGHGWVDVLAFGHGAVLGLVNHIFDDGKGRTNAPSGGSGPFAEVRCPLETGWRAGPEGTEGLVQPSRECCYRLLL